MSEHPSFSRAPIVPERVRRIDGQSFGFVPHRFLRDGFLVSLTRDELALYLILVLAGDRQGLSYYHYDTLCSILEVPLERYLEARNGLLQKDLVAFDGTRFQVLSLPARAVHPPSVRLESEADFKRRDPATIRCLILDGLADPTDPDDR